MLLCGIPWVDAVFNEVDPWISIHWHFKEGEWINTPNVLCHIEGSAKSILTAERTALNFLQTLSATATQTFEYVKVLENTKTRLLDTRKTLPGLRMAQKYAVHTAGGVNHRMGLYDAYLIKENHIKASGSISKAIELAKQAGNGLFIEVEVENREQLEEAFQAKPHRILLDNFSIQGLKEAVALKAKLKGCELEASGGITLKNIASIAETGVDYVSIGAITKSIQAIDLSLLIRETL
jgi:nicotinate-nucleotide pyrophosphorylase (carboxylating)